MPEYITTYGGTHFYPTAPKAADIHAEDIAHALSLICRGNGHVKTFFSVGQHCIFCAREAAARGYSSRIILACLLHDAGECYLSDVPSPFKKELPMYSQREDHLLELIYRKYLRQALSSEEQAAVEAIDKALLYYDLKYLLNEPPDSPAPELKSPISYEVRPFAQVEQEYLQLYHFYQAEVLRDWLLANARITGIFQIRSDARKIVDFYENARRLGHPEAAQRKAAFIRQYQSCFSVSRMDSGANFLSEE